MQRTERHRGDLRVNTQINQTAPTQESTLKVEVSPSLEPARVGNRSVVGDDIFYTVQTTSGTIWPGCIVDDPSDEFTFGDHVLLKASTTGPPVIFSAGSGAAATATGLTIYMAYAPSDSLVL